MFHQPHTQPIQPSLFEWDDFEDIPVAADPNQQNAHIHDLAHEPCNEFFFNNDSVENNQQSATLLDLAHEPPTEIDDLLQFFED